MEMKKIEKRKELLDHLVEVSGGDLKIVNAPYSNRKKMLLYLPTEKLIDVSISGRVGKYHNRQVHDLANHVFVFNSSTHTFMAANLKPNFSAFFPTTRAFVTRTATMYSEIRLEEKNIEEKHKGHIEMKTKEPMPFLVNRETLSALFGC